MTTKSTVPLWASFVFHFSMNANQGTNIKNAIGHHETDFAFKFLKNLIFQKKIRRKRIVLTNPNVTMIKGSAEVDTETAKKKNLKKTFLAKFFSFVDIS
jgi:hypothetical protein